MAQDEHAFEARTGEDKPHEAEEIDVELQAMNATVSALKPLTKEQRSRVLEYIQQRFNLPESMGIRRKTDTSDSIFARLTEQTAVPAAQLVSTDIRTLKELKSPSSAIQMATLVAYYLSELAPEADRKAVISKSDVERYFKMASFKLPTDAKYTLLNAKNAGYLDSAGGGEFRLNPVGYNLVAHRMGGDGEKQSPAVARRAAVNRNRRQAKKARSAKK